MKTTHYRITKSQSQPRQWLRKKLNISRQEIGLFTMPLMLGFLFFLIVSAFCAPSYGISTFEQAMIQAGQGGVKAQVQVGDAYAKGRGVPQDYKLAFNWYEKAAEQGYAQGQRPLGVLYELGRGVNKNYVKAAFWYEKAALQGLARAQVNLGILYETGQGVEQDYLTALSWYKKATDQGYGRGINKLGLLYEKGLGGKVDMNRAITLYERGAKVKYSKAMLNLGRIYSAGVAGVAVDLEAAAQWYQKAVNLGYIDALPDLQRVKAMLAKVPEIVVVPEDLEKQEPKIEPTLKKGLLKPKKELLKPKPILPNKIEPRPPIMAPGVEPEPYSNIKKEAVSLLLPLFIGSVVGLVIFFLCGLFFMKKKRMASLGSGLVMVELERDIKKIRHEVEQLAQIYE